ncbi:MAG: sulfatase [Bacteroidota bacterium]
MRKPIYIITLFLSIQAFAQRNEPVEKMNVLFIITDDLNMTNLSFYGAGVANTPNLDQLAESGTVFERAYCQVPVCNPSRASIMTGKTSQSLRIWNNEPHFRGMYPKIITLPQRFKSNGYYTAGIGKIYHNWAQSIQGDPKSWSAPELYHYAPHYRDWYVPGRPYEIHNDLSKGPSVQKADVPDEAYLDGRIANEVVKRLSEIREVPFFLAVGFWKPHMPYNAPKKYWDLYDPKDLPAIRYKDKVEGVPEIAYINSPEAASYTDVKKGESIPEAKRNELRHGYLAAISYLDAQIGKILRELERLGLADNTIIVFTSDHGYHAGEHGQFGKWTNFEVGTRVPLIIKIPNVQNRRSNSLAGLVDLYPTLLELCGLSPSHEVDGNSLVPTFEHTNAQVNDLIVSQIARPAGAVSNREVLGTSLRDENYRYNVWVDESNGEIIAEELYDLSTDFLKVQNVINDKKYKSAKKMLSQKAQEILSKTNYK